MTGGKFLWMAGPETSFLLKQGWSLAREQMYSRMAHFPSLSPPSYPRYFSSEIHPDQALSSGPEPRSARV